ncbi:MAG TPA: hypothetical protein VFG41_00605 [Sphingomicrobium sp.]|nr:hypothetical protein [Sphingomicrobium sp.]
MARPNSAADWSRLMLDASRLWSDAGAVIALRSWRMMAGGAAAQRELESCVSEKVEAGFELAGALAGGRIRSPEAAARKAMNVYGRKVRANRKRLG